MSTMKSVGRMIGLLLIAQIILGAFVNFVLLVPVIRNPPGFLVSAAAHPMQVGVTALLGLVAGALSIAVAIVALPVFRRYSHALAWWFLALAIAALSVTVVESSAVMSMLSFSQAYAKASPADAGLFEALRVVVASWRNWSHFTHMLVGGAAYLVFYIVLFRFALIPRALAGLGAAAVALQMIAVSMPFFGYPVASLMITPMGIAHLAASLWVAVKGFTPSASVLEPSEDRMRVSDV